MNNLKKPPMSTQIILTLLIIGLAAGMLSGLVGIGGGIIVIPCLIFFLGYTQHQAQGTSLGLLSIPVVLLAFLQYYKDSKGSDAPIDLKVIGILAVTFILGAFLGGNLALKIEQGLLKKIFAVVLFFSAFKLLSWDKVIISWVKQLF